MKKLFFFLLCAICIVTVESEANTITIQGTLYLLPKVCTSEPCPTGHTWAICTADKTYFVKDKDENQPVTITISGMVFTLDIGDKVAATGTPTTIVDVNGVEHDMIDVSSIQYGDCNQPMDCETITIQGKLVTMQEPIGYTTCTSLAIATSEKTYFVKGKCGETQIETTTGSEQFIFEEGDEIVVAGYVTSHVDNDGNEFYRVVIFTIHVVEQNPITVQGTLRIKPNFCAGSPCRTGMDWTICTADKTYFIKGKDDAQQITTTIDGKKIILEEGDEVIATGILKTFLDVANERKFHEIAVTSIQPAETTAVEVVQAEPIDAHKVIENGRFVIIREGVRYNVLGAQME